MFTSQTCINLSAQTCFIWCCVISFGVVKFCDPGNMKYLCTLLVTNSYKKYRQFIYFCPENDKGAVKKVDQHEAMSILF